MKREHFSICGWVSRREEMVRRSGDRIGTTENGGGLEDWRVLSGMEASFAEVASLCGVRVAAMWTVNPGSPFEGQRFLQNERHVHLLLCGSWLTAACSSPWTKSELDPRLGEKVGKQRNGCLSHRLAGWPGRPCPCISRSFSFIF